MNHDTDTSLSRRNLLLGAGGLIGLAATGSALAGGGHEHHNSDHGNVQNPLIGTSMDCVHTSQACLAHCLDEFKRGDTEMADCAQAVQESAAMCTALWQMASLGSTHVSAVAVACLDVCETCEKACDEFSDKHDVCRECRDSCRALIKEIKRAA